MSKNECDMHETEMRVEWEAWLDVVDEFRRLNIDIDSTDNKYARLIKAICLWGEQLHTLRAEQTNATVAKAREDYLRQYDVAKRNNP